MINNDLVINYIFIYTFIHFMIVRTTYQGSGKVREGKIPGAQIARNAIQTAVFIYVDPLGKVPANFRMGIANNNTTNKII